MQTNHSDFLIIGAGIAGLVAALELAKYGSVNLVTKASLKESNSALAQGGIAVCLNLEDSFLSHYQDTLKAGSFFNHPHHTQILIDQAPTAVRQLIDLGVEFDRLDDGSQLHLAREGSHSHARIIHAGGDQTGQRICSHLAQLVGAQSNITIIPEHMVIELSVSENHCYGCLALHNDQTVSFTASSTLLASGGYSGIYPDSTNNVTINGDGIAAGHRAGVNLQDLEFIQFHPTTLAHPTIKGFLISEAVRGEGALLINERGQRFMPNYHPLGELAPRDIVSRAIYREIQNSAISYVYLDVTRLQPHFTQRFPMITQRCRELGIDLNSDPIPVKPGAHYSIGGITTNSFGQTSVHQLWAAGEVARTGVHGANRLASNSLLECLVFAKRAAKQMVAMQVTHNKMPQIQYWNNTKSPISHQETEAINQRVSTIVNESLGIYRSYEQIRLAQQELASLKSTLTNHYTCSAYYYQTLNKTTVAGLIAAAALQRPTSIGCHYFSENQKRGVIYAS